MPTLLTLIGIREFPGLDGSNIWRVVNGNAAAIHDRLISAYDDFAAVRDPRWHYFQNVRSSDPGHGPALYDLTADPAGAADVAAQHPDIVAQCRGWISAAMKIDLSPAG
jgi:arylsulfatase A-like enzyme